VFKEREELETIAEFAATQIAAHTSILQEFPVDVNRLVLEYLIGSDGRHAKKFQQEQALFLTSYQTQT
jgi:hypothetical protein